VNLNLYFYERDFGWKNSWKWEIDFLLRNFMPENLRFHENNRKNSPRFQLPLSLEERGLGRVVKYSGFSPS
jgi:hypothetical protein